MNPHVENALNALVTWAQQEAERAGKEGRPLTEDELGWARLAGVQHPEVIRLQVVDRLPEPAEPQLQAILRQVGLSVGDAPAMTLGTHILVCRGQESRGLIGHECRHVRQVEEAGSLEAFLRTYALQVLQHGYANAPYEVDARAWERGNYASH